MLIHGCQALFRRSSPGVPAAGAQCCVGLCAGDAAQEVVRLVERALRDSHAVDLEALCVIAGRRVRIKLVPVF
jgi:exosome complex RNA-binding protein Rrp42 (RNase PH superfamily)